MVTLTVTRYEDTLLAKAQELTARRDRRKTIERHLSRITKGKYGGLRGDEQKGN
jgi:hypothetical protein